jgi:hypothetical protein
MHELQALRELLLVSHKAIPILKVGHAGRLPPCSKAFRHPRSQLQLSGVSHRGRSPRTGKHCPWLPAFFGRPYIRQTGSPSQEKQPIAEVGKCVTGGRRRGIEAASMLLHPWI